MSDKKCKVLFACTHPQQFNGYARVGYELIKSLCNKHKNVEVHYFGFQNYYYVEHHAKDRLGELPDNVIVYDAYGNEQPKQKGFGLDDIENYIQIHDFDMVMVYNDLVVVSMLLKKLISIPDRKFKLVPYVDQVYQYQVSGFYRMLQDHCDGLILFTDYWKNNAIQRGITLDCDYVPHGVNKKTLYQIPKHLCRDFLGLPKESTIFLNLNRNQPRKRWDIMISSWILFLKKLNYDPEANVKLIVGTPFVASGWDIHELIVSYCNIHGADVSFVKTTIIGLDRAQKLSDKEITILYNAADVGVNTCDGEGFGLCNFEQASVGVPQVVPKLGGFLDYFDDDNSILVEHSWTYFSDTSRDAVSGLAKVCDPEHFAEAYLKYYNDKELRKKHGENAMKKIRENYDWDKVSEKFYDIISKYCDLDNKDKKDETDSLYDDDEIIIIEGEDADGNKIDVSDASFIVEEGMVEIKDSNVVEIKPEKNEIFDINKNKKISDMENQIKDLNEKMNTLVELLMKK